jgi:hypothetical protein
MEMADITWTHVTNMSSELSAVSAAAQVDILAHVNLLAADKLGGEASPRYKLARVLLAAHYGKLSMTNGATPAGPVIAESEGQVSRAYGFMGGAASAEMSSTVWGREYIAMVRRSGAARAPMVT